MQKETMSKERVEDELLNKANLEIIDKEIPEFVNYLNELDVYYINNQSLSKKLNYLSKKTLINYKDKIKKLLDINISWGDFGYLINELRADFKKKHSAELLRRFLEILPKQYHQYITGVEELTRSEARQLRSGKYIIFCTYEDLDGIADGDSFNANSLEEGVEQVINYFSE